MRYPPFTPKKLDLMRKAGGGTIEPNFGRDGKLLPRSLVSWVLLLGAHSKKGATFRCLLLMAGKKHNYPQVIRCSGSRGMRKDETSYGYHVTMSVTSTDAHENAGAAMLKTFLSAKN